MLLQSGDPRPIFAHYLVQKFTGLVSYHPTKIVAVCKNGKRAIDLEKAVYHAPSTPFVIFGVVIEGKFGCSTNKPTQRTHMIYALWNVESKKMYIYNPLAYHLEKRSDFSVKSVSGKIREAMPIWLKQHGHDDIKAFTTSVDESLIKRVKNWYAEKLGREAPAHLWFPIINLWEIEVMMKNPSITRKAVHELMEKGDLSILERHNDAFMKFYIETVYARCTSCKKNCICNKCKENYILHPETNRCVQSDGDSGIKIRGIKKTSGPKGFNFVERNVKSMQSRDKKTFLDKEFGKDRLATYLTAQYKHAAIMKGVMLWISSNDEGGMLIIPRHFDKFWESALKDDKIQQIVAPLDLSLKGDKISHANVLIFTKPTNELEIFEPNGVDLAASFRTDKLYEELGAYMKDKFNHGKLITPNEYCPRKVAIFQSLEVDEFGLWTSQGYCAVWATWYLENRLNNPAIKTTQVVKQAMNRLVDYGSLRDFIWNYDRWMRRQLEGKK